MRGSHTNDAYEAMSSSSSLSELTSHLQDAEQNPGPSSKIGKAKVREEERFQEIDLQQHIDHQRMRSALQEVISDTNSAQINPARDGVYARLNRFLARGAGAFGVGFNLGNNTPEILKNLTFNNSSNNKTTIPTTIPPPPQTNTTSTEDDDDDDNDDNDGDGITNPIG